MFRSSIILISVVTGIYFGYTAYGWEISIALILGGILIWLISRRLQKKISNYILMKRLQLVWPCFFLAGIGSISSYYCYPYPQSMPDNIPFRIQGSVMDRTSTTAGEQYTVSLISIRNDSNEYECKNIKAYLLTSGSVILEPGDIIEYTSILAELENHRPGRPAYMTFDKIRVYNGEKSRSGKEIFHYRNGNLKIIGQQKNIIHLAWELRESITIKLENSHLSEESSKLLKALLTGIRKGISTDRLSKFRDAGVAHTLAVSGMHVGILAAMLMFLSIPLNIIKGRNCRYLIIIVAAWVFTIFTGLLYSTLRCTIMMTLAALAELSDRPHTSYGSVCMAASLVLLASPTALWDIGFQLSFTCVASLCLFVDPLNPIERRNHPLLYYAVSVVLTTIVATSSTWIITAYYFGTLPLNFLISNLVILPLLPIIMTGGLFLIVLQSTDFHCIWLSDFINYIVDNIYSLLDNFSHSILEISPGIEAVGFWMVGIVLSALALNSFSPSARMHPGSRTIQPITIRYFGLSIKSLILALAFVFFFITFYLLFKR